MGYFISTSIPILTNLLCSTCSGHAKDFIRARHPSQYLKKYDHRNENIGMFLWMFDLHNDVNRRLKKPELPLEYAMAIYEPILSLSTAELEQDAKAALSPKTIDQIATLSFVDEDIDEAELESLMPEKTVERCRKGC